MKTDDLIKVLNADAGRKPMALAWVWLAAGIAAAAVAASVFFMMIGPRPDIDDAMSTMRFNFKFVVTLVLAATAFLVFERLARPGASVGRIGRSILVAPLLLAAAVVMELFAVSPTDWQARWIGTNMTTCLTFIPLIGIGPLAIFLFALGRAAPTRPSLAGAVAGLLAGGVAATFYAAHCTDDSPLFVATWYTLAIGALTLAGSGLGRAFVRW